MLRSPKQAASALTELVTAVAILFLCTELSGLNAPGTNGEARLLAVAMLLLIGLPEALSQGRRALLIAAVSAPILVGILWLPAPVATCTWLAALCAAWPAQRALLRSALIGSALLMVGQVVWLPDLWFSWVQSPLATLLGRENFIAAGASAGDPVVFFALWTSAAGTLLNRPRWRSMLFLTMGGLSMFALAQVRLSVLDAELRFPLDRASLGSQHLRLLSIACGAIAVAVLRSSTSASRHSRQEAEGSTPSRPALYTAALLVALYGLLLYSLRSETRDPGNALVLVGSGSNLETAEHGTYGPYSSGMFGLLPRYLELGGLDCEASDDAERLWPYLAENPHGLLVLANPTVEWTALQLDQFNSWLQGGGRCLWLTDHTDVFGTASAGNPLLGRYSTEVRFDSAYHATQSWRNEAHPSFGLAWGPGVEMSGGFHGIGASISAPWSAFPLLRAPFGLSDVGERQNVMGSYLGNYATDLGERLGGLLLAGRIDVGKGSITIIGDTTAFQNSSLPNSHSQVVWPLLKSMELSRWGVRAPILCALLSFLLASAFCHRLTLLAAAFLPVAGAYAESRWSPQHQIEELYSNGDVVLIDTGFAPDIGFYDIKYNSAGSLTTAIVRHGYLPMYANALEVLREQPRGSTLPAAIALIGSQIKASTSEIRDFQDYLEAGGSVLNLLTYEADGAGTQLAAMYGVRAQGQILGKFPSALLQDHPMLSLPSFQEAWPLSIDPRGVAIEVICQIAGVQLGVTIEAGQGQLVVLGDHRFFNSTNVEGIWGFDEENVRFTDMLLNHGLGLERRNPNFQ